MSEARVAMVVISHSKKLAEGVQELAQQMAPSVTILPAGGRDDGGIGTSFDLVSDACDRALAASDGKGAVILTDLGSANMVAESVIEFADDPSLLVLVDAPLVESAVVGAVACEQGDSLDRVVQTIEDTSEKGRADARVEPVEQNALSGDAVTAQVTIVDKSGLHARPAAEFVKMASVFDAEILIDTADAKSLMEVMALGRRYGEQVTITATGPQADQAVENLSRAIADGFDK